MKISKVLVFLIAICGAHTVLGSCAGDDTSEIQDVQLPSSATSIGAINRGSPEGASSEGEQPVAILPVTLDAGRGFDAWNDFLRDHPDNPANLHGAKRKVTKSAVLNSATPSPSEQEDPVQYIEEGPAVLQNVQGILDEEVPLLRRQVRLAKMDARSIKAKRLRKFLYYAALIYHVPFVQGFVFVTEVGLSSYFNFFAGTLGRIIVAGSLDMFLAPAKHEKLRVLLYSLAQCSGLMFAKLCEYTVHSQQPNVNLRVMDLYAPSLFLLSMGAVVGLFTCCRAGMREHEFSQHDARTSPLRFLFDCMGVTVGDALQGLLGSCTGLGSHVVHGVAGLVSYLVRTGAHFVHDCISQKPIWRVLKGIKFGAS